MNYVRVMTYNIKAGRFQPDGLEALFRVIAAQAPDILAVQEVDEAMPRSGGVAQTDWLARRLRTSAVYAPALQRDGGRYGIALLSRLPVQAHEIRRLFRPAYADAERRPRHDSEPRVALGAALATPIGLLKIIVTHLGLTADQRAVQAREVAGFAATWGGEAPTVVAGDFNCAPDAPELAPMRERFRETCAMRGISGDARITFPSGAERERAIDHVWVSRDIFVHSARVVADESRASDHRPVVVEISLGSAGAHPAG